MNTTRENINVLIVEDDPHSAELYQRILKISEKISFKVKWADCLAKALEYERSRAFDVILSDLSLPDSHGLNTFLKVREQAQDTPIIILTGSDDDALALQSIGEGAQDYIAKDKIDQYIFMRAITYAIERSRIQKDLRNAKKDLEVKIKERTFELRTEKDKLERILVETVRALGSSLDKRDPYTAGHQRRVAQLSVAIAKNIGLSEAAISGLLLAALVHDIGKIGVPLEILVKPSQLNENEMKLVRAHSEIGYDILKDIEFPWPIAQIVFQHHERIDGSGYPQGLSGDKILLESRILGVADVVEAMSSHRPYRPAVGMKGALEEISRNRGILYEPGVVDACSEVFRKGDFRFEESLMAQR
jgi:response regulator RpfG family c-di-GMP phosphodiesterase